jgi:HEAT repeat protein/beta-lactamase regulating signal transducer with metallopeptidase domain
MTGSLASTALAWLLTYAIHSTALLSLAWLALHVRRWTPAAADLLWKSAMLGGILTATLQLQLDVRPAGTVSLQRAGATRAVPTVERARDVPERAPVGISEPSPAAPAPIDAAPAAARPTAEALVVGLWATIALVLAVSYAGRRLILVGRLGDRDAVRDGPLLDMLDELWRDAGLRSAPRLTTTSRISSPIALGFREICIPDTALTDLDLEQQRSMLAHELAHLARRDPVWMGLASLVERILWIQPLNRVARRQLARSAEFLCDDWAVRRTGSGIALARCLAQVAEWIQASPLGVPVAGMAEERSLLVSRVARLLEGGTPAARSRRGLTLVAVIVLAATIVVAPGVSSTSARTLRASAPMSPRTDDPDVMEQARLDTSAGGASALTPPALTAREMARSPQPRLNGTDSSIVIALVARLKDEDAKVREAAAHSLGHLGDARAVPGLIDALKDPEPRVRAAAAEALGELEDPRAITALSGLLADPSTEVKQNALDALSQFEDGVPSTGVVRLLTDGDAEIRHRAAHLAGKLRDRSAGPALAKLVQDSNADVRQATLEALGELKDVSAVPAILPALADANADVRHQALNTLEELRAPIPAETLIGLMKDSNADVRSKAADLAGERSVIAAIPALRQLLVDGNADVRGSAISALGNIADAGAYEALRGALTSKDPKVRRAAVEALGERRP